MKKIDAWLRMMNIGGDYPVPMSEESYEANTDNLDMVFPCHGGKLQGDGTYLQEEWKLNHEFAQGLKEQAHINNQIYMPMVSKKGDILSLLQSTELQKIAAHNLVELATVSRFDSPWDGVMLNIEGIPSVYKPQLNNFLYLLDQQLHTAGLKVGVAIRGRTGDDGPDYDDAYSHDFSVVGQVADIISLYCYGYWKPGSWAERSIAPYWWIKKSIEYALGCGIPEQRLSLGLANYSLYYPDLGQSTRYETTHDKAIELVTDSQSKIEWLESAEYGLIREKFADLGLGHIWIQDIDTLRHGLDLVDDYDLLGANIFVLGMEDERIWNVIAEWKGG